MSKLVTLTKAQVPSYLTESEFYKNLSADDDDEFCIPQEYYKSTLSVANAEHLSHLFHTMKFWGLCKLPHEIIELLIFDPKAVFADKRASVSKVLLEFDKEFGLHTLYQALSECTCEEERLGVAINCGREDVLEYLYLFHPMSDPFTLALLKAVAENGYINLLERIAGIVLLSIKNPLKGVSVSTVASRGYTECLRLLLEKGCGKQKDTCRVAAENGHLPCLKLAHEHGCSFNKMVRNAAAHNGHLDCLKYTLEHGCPVDADVVCEAAQGGQLECLQYLIDQGVKITKRTYQSAVIGGNVECVKLLEARGAPPCDLECARLAAQHGRLTSLQYLIDLGCNVDHTVTQAAAQAGHVQCLQFLLEKKCEVRQESVFWAAEGGHMNCLHVLKGYILLIPSEESQQGWLFRGDGVTFARSLFEAGYEVPCGTIEFAMRNGYIQCMQYLCLKKLCALTANLTELAASCYTNRLPMLKILHRYNCPWGGETCRHLVQYFDLESLVFAQEHGCPWDEQTVSAAIQREGQACLEYALKHGCPVSEDACELAATRGLLDVLKCLHERGCVLSLKTCVAAAMNKYTDCLTYAVTHGAPMDATVCEAAASNVVRHYNNKGNCVQNSLQVLQCAHKLGCPWDERTCTAAASYEDGLECLKYALENGCSFTVDACIAAAAHGQLLALQLLLAYHCPWDERVSQAAAKSGGFSCLRYCVDNGCPIDADIMARYNTMVGLVPTG